MILQIDNWIALHSRALERIFTIVFGLVWVIDGSFKFTMNVSSYLVSSLVSVASGQPSWLHPWFEFWIGQISMNPVLVTYLDGIIEIAIGIALIAGFCRKIAYLGGFVLSLFIWSVPEGFGGPYVPGTTDVGTGIIYAIAFLFLLVLLASNGPEQYTLDNLIEKRIKIWEKLAEFKHDAGRY